jgi:tetratricopeptide (TPR) repeat protein
LKSYGLAENAFKRVIQMDPKIVEAYIGLASIL